MKQTGDCKTCGFTWCSCEVPARCDCHGTAEQRAERRVRKPKVHDPLRAWRPKTQEGRRHKVATVKPAAVKPSTARGRRRDGPNGKPARGRRANELRQRTLLRLNVKNGYGNHADGAVNKRPAEGQASKTWGHLEAGTLKGRAA
jgi:hypothetical protein